LNRFFFCIISFYCSFSAQASGVKIKIIECSKQLMTGTGMPGAPSFPKPGDASDAFSIAPPRLAPSPKLYRYVCRSVTPKKQGPTVTPRIISPLRKGQ